MAKICQSCSMPMNRDKNGGGSNTDGTKSTHFCSLCFENGAFTHPNFSAQEMQDFCVSQLQNQGLPKVMAWMFTRSIPKLDRWKN